MSNDSGHAQAADGQAAGTDEQTGMRLDHLPAEPSGGPAPGPVPGLGSGPGDFASTPKQKQDAAGTIETELEPNTKKAAEVADDATSTAQKGFDGWETAAGLKAVAETCGQAGEGPDVPPLGGEERPARRLRPLRAQRHGHPQPVPCLAVEAERPVRSPRC